MGSMTVCTWCDTAMPAAARTMRPGERRFCNDAHRNAFYSALRKAGERMFERGDLTIGHVRANTLPPVHGAAAADFPETVRRFVTDERDSSDWTFRQLALLRVIADGPREVHALAAQIRVAKPVVSRGLTKLAAAGLAVRQPVHGDKRRVVAVITDLGVATLQHWARP